MRINDKGNDIIVEPLNSFSFKSVTPFQTKFNTNIKKNNKYLHQLSLLLNELILRVTMKNIYQLEFQNKTHLLLPMKDLHEESYSTITKSKATTTLDSTTAINVQTKSQPTTNFSQI